MSNRNVSKIYCCGCRKTVEAYLTDGTEVYPHRSDLSSLPFWKCPKCSNTVGCHHKTNQPTRPLGVIPTPEIKRVRRQIHQVLDPLWKRKKIHRRELYAKISQYVGYEYHTAEIKSLNEGNKIICLIQKLTEELHDD